MLWSIPGLTLYGPVAYAVMVLTITALLLILGKFMSWSRKHRDEPDLAVSPPRASTPGQSAACAQRSERGLNLAVRVGLITSK